MRIIRLNVGLMVAAALFLGGVAFGQGRSTGPRPARKPVEVLSGHFSGVVFTLFVNKDVAQSWLPAGLRISQASPFSDQHPVIVLYGTQTELTRQKRVTIKLPRGHYYHETFIAVPYLESHQFSQPVFHFVRIYLNEEKLAEQGIRRFGWPKIPTPIEAKAGTYRILGETADVLFDGHVSTELSEPLVEGNQSFEAVRKMLSQPLVLQHQGILNRYNFDLHFESAKIRSLPTEIRIHDGFMPKLGTIAVKAAGINQERWGSFSIDTHFTKTAMD